CVDQLGVLGGHRRIDAGEEQRATAAGTEALSHQVVGLAGSLVFLQVPGVAEAEADREQRQRQQDQQTDADQQRRPWATLDQTAPAVPELLLTWLGLMVRQVLAQRPAE